MRVLGYVRVSTSEQASEGVSLAAQREKVRLYCELHGLELLGFEEDAGVSAKSLDRPGLRRVLSALSALEADGLVVAKLDRLSRSVLDWSQLIAGYFSPERGSAQLFSVGDSIDTRTATGRMVLNVMMSIAQWERETIVERTRDALAHKRRRSERIGTVPYGFAVAADGRTLVPHEAEQLALARMRAWHAEGLSLRALGRRLEESGCPPRGAASWSPTTLARLLSRPEEAR